MICWQTTSISSSSNGMLVNLDTASGLTKPKSTTPSLIQLQITVYSPWYISK